MNNFEKTLYLVRHAKSSWKFTDLSDFERPLNSRGKSDAPFMGELLARQIILPDIIISSPAKRAIATAEIIADKIIYEKELIVQEDELYHASSSTIIKILAMLENENSAMIFGHNPGLTVFCNLVSDNYIENIPTCGIVALRFNNNWKEIKPKSAEQIFFDFPKNYPNRDGK